MPSADLPGNAAGAAAGLGSDAHDPLAARDMLVAPRDVLAEARTAMTICNACRYCEGLCAVFPAMERRLAFSDSDLRYLANLCHDCRECFYACQYAPPHEFGINLPDVFGALRRETYERHARPAVIGRAYRRNGLAVATAAAAAALAVPVLALLLGDPGVLGRAHVGPGAFYQVVPMALMVGPASIVAVLASVAMIVAGVDFWRDTGGGSVRSGTLLRAGVVAVRLTYLGGDGEGCTYPAERFSTRRRWLHHLVFWGFMIDLASTSTAAIYEHLLHRLAPYPLTSLPVLLGTGGGLMLVAGTTGLLLLKRRSDPLPTDAGSMGMDVAFLALLWATSLTGLMLLAARETTAMPILLLVHLGAVAGFFVTIPFGKFVHAMYRYLALVRDRLEEECGGRAA